MPVKPLTVTTAPQEEVVAESQAYDEWRKFGGASITFDTIEDELEKMLVNAFQEGAMHGRATCNNALAKGGGETAMDGITVACVCGHEFEAPTDLAFDEHVHCPNCGSYFDVCHACRALGPDGSLLFRISKKQVAVLKKYLAQWKKGE